MKILGMMYVQMCRHNFEFTLKNGVSLVINLLHDLEWNNISNNILSLINLSSDINEENVSDIYATII